MGRRPRPVTEAQSRRDRTIGEARRRGALAAIVILATALAAVAAVIVAFNLWGDTEPSGPPRAVLVDQLAATDPNADFVKEATRLLEAAGYVVDYIPAADVTVDSYRDLPERGYKFIILRSHSSDFVGERDAITGVVVRKWSIGLFTNEPYSKETHIEDQRAKRLAVEQYADVPAGERYFGITAEFIARSTRGRFAGATVVLMGCAGLKTDDLARAFVAKGVKNFVSWDLFVTARHTDAATANLLHNLFGLGLDLHEAVARTTIEVGPDPIFGAHLLTFP